MGADAEAVFYLTRPDLLLDLAAADLTPPGHHLRTEERLTDVVARPVQPPGRAGGEGRTHRRADQLRPALVVEVPLVGDDHHVGPRQVRQTEQSVHPLLELLPDHAPSLAVSYPPALLDRHVVEAEHLLEDQVLGAASRV